MVARVIYGDSEFVGASIGDLPRLPARVPVAGFARRWFAQHFDQFPDGTTIVEWPDTVVKSKLTPAGSLIGDATNPILATRGDHRVVRFDGAKNALGVSYTPAKTEPFTVTMVMYLPASPAANGFLYALSDTELKALYTDSAGVPVFRSVGSATAPAALSAGWHVITGVADGANTRLRIDDGQTFTYAASTAFTRSMISLGRSAWGGGALRFDVADVVEWPTALTPSQVDEVHAQFKTRYGI